MKRTLIILGIAASLALGAGARGQTSITLRPGASVSAGEAVRLDALAALAGPEAERLGAIEIPRAVLGPRRTISVEELRRVLTDAGVNWSVTTLRGGTCAVRVVEEAAPVATAAREELVVQDHGLRGALTAKIAQILRVDVGDVRTEFSASDRDLLDLPAGGRTIEVRTVGVSERMALAIAIIEGDRIIASKTIRVAVQVRRPVVIAASAKRRGHVLGEGDLTRDVQWLSPTVNAVEPEKAIGAAVKSRLSAGEIITAGDLAPAIVVNKGDHVMVRAIAGTVSVMTRARALAAAGDGELVQLAALDDPKRVITARMEGRGRAVLVAAPPLLRE